MLAKRFPSLRDALLDRRHTNDGEEDEKYGGSGTHDGGLKVF